MSGQTVFQLSNIIRPSKIKEATGLSRATCYRLAKAGKFPKPIKLSANATGWRGEDIARWLAEREEVHQAEAAA